MTFIAIFFIAFLISTNILFVWYIRRLWNIIEDTKEGIKDMKEAISAFSEHLQVIYKQDTYYGEPTIERLIKHSKVLIQEMDQFIKVFLVANETELSDNGEKTNKE